MFSKANPLPPVHLHIKDDIPIHVHVLSPKKHVNTLSKSKKKKTPEKAAVSRQLIFKDSSPKKDYCDKSNISMLSTLKNPERTVTKGKSFQWTGPGSSLIVNPLKKSLNRSASKKLCDNDISLKDYFKEIDHLIDEVGTRKSKGDAHISPSFQYSPHELDSFTKEIDDAFCRELLKRSLSPENNKSQKELFQNSSSDKSPFHRFSSPRISSPDYKESSINNQKSSNISSFQNRCEDSTKQNLLKKLVETEMQASDAMEQAYIIRNNLKKIAEGSHMSPEEFTILLQQQKKLLSRLTDFEAGSQVLLQLLQKQQDNEVASQKLYDKQNILKSRIQELEELNKNLRYEITQKNQDIIELNTQACTQNEQFQLLKGLLKSTERQFHNKEKECLETAAKLKETEDVLEIERSEIGRMQFLVNEAKAKVNKDEELIKKEIRHHKENSVLSKSKLDFLKLELQDKETFINSLQTQLEVWKDTFTKINQEKSALEKDKIVLKAKLLELESMRSTVQEDYKYQLESLTVKLNDKIAELVMIKLEVDQLKTDNAKKDEKLIVLESECTRLATGLSNYESIINYYKSQMDHYQQEKSEIIQHLSQQEDTAASRQQEKSDSEAEMKKLQLQKRMIKLEMLPDKVQTLEKNLREALDRAATLEKQKMGFETIISDFETKYDHCRSQLHNMKIKLNAAEGAVQAAESRMALLERKLTDFENENLELKRELVVKAGHLEVANHKLDEHTQEGISLLQQVDSTLGEAKLQNEQLAMREKTAFARIKELEVEIALLKKDLAQERQQHEENMQVYKMKMMDLKDRLEQSLNTNRSMQNYVSYLKNSYSSVFDTAIPLTSSPKHSYRDFTF